LTKSIIPQVIIYVYIYCIYIYILCVYAYIYIHLYIDIDIYPQHFDSNLHPAFLWGWDVEFAPRACRIAGLCPLDADRFLEAKWCFNVVKTDQNHGDVTIRYYQTSKVYIFNKNCKCALTMNFIFPSIGKNNPNWRPHIFQEPPSRFCLNTIRHTGMFEWVV
jgi:hypothetical protein